MAAKTFVKDATLAWREIQEIHVKDSSTWRAVQEAYVNDNGTWRQVFVAYQEPASFTTGSRVGNNT